jgi:hypothetical protein
MVGVRMVKRGPVTVHASSAFRLARHGHVPALAAVPQVDWIGPLGSLERVELHVARLHERDQLDVFRPVHHRVKR